jgi:hypothetical protein
VGTPVCTSDYVREYVRNKCGTICKDVETMRICSDPLIRYHLLKFCMNTRLSFLSRNVTPDNMATSSTDPAHIGHVHVDQKIVKEVLSAATGDTIAKKQTQRMQNWCKFIVQSPQHKGGYAITPTAASDLAAFYSATAKFVTLLASLPRDGAWVRGVRTSRFTTHGKTPSYKNSSRPMPASFRTTNAQNGARKTPLTKSAIQLLPPRIRCPRSPPLSSFPL